MLALLIKLCGVFMRILHFQYFSTVMKKKTLLISLPPNINCKSFSLPLKFLEAALIIYFTISGREKEIRKT